MSQRRQSASVEAGLQPGSSVNATKPTFSPQILARLWPNHVHESSWLKSSACYFGLHRWAGHAIWIFPIVSSRAILPVVLQDKDFVGSAFRGGPFYDEEAS